MKRTAGAGSQRKVSVNPPPPLILSVICPAANKESAIIHTERRDRKIPAPAGRIGIGNYMCGKERQNKNRIQA